MVTRADVACNGQTAALTQAGKSLHARLHAAESLHFEAIPADPPEDGISAPNPDTRILIVCAPADASGKLRLSVRLRVGVPPIAEFAAKPLSTWE
jgi:hypothetical protein